MNLFNQQSNEFHGRHIGPNQVDTQAMLATIGMDSLETLISKTVPDSIRIKEDLDIPAAISEFEYLSELKKVAAKNKVYRTYLWSLVYGLYSLGRVFSFLLSYFSLSTRILFPHN